MAADAHAAMNASAWAISPDGARVLYACETVALYRHSRNSRYRVLTVAIGLGRVVALYCCPSTLYQIHEHIRYVYF